MAHKEGPEKLWNMRSFGGHPIRGLNRNTSQLVSTTRDDGSAAGQQMNVLRKLREHISRRTRTVSQHTLLFAFKEMASVIPKYQFLCLDGYQIN